MLTSPGPRAHLWQGMPRLERAYRRLARPFTGEDESETERRHRRALHYIRLSQEHTNILTVCTLRSGECFAALQWYMVQSTWQYTFGIQLVVVAHMLLQVRPRPLAPSPPCVLGRDPHGAPPWGETPMGPLHGERPPWGPSMGRDPPWGPSMGERPPVGPLLGPQLRRVARDTCAVPSALAHAAGL
jgi:hypothetical protein